MPVYGDKINPIGSLEAVRAAGLDTAIEPTCARPDRNAGVLGCEVWGRCPFGDQRLGGFKGTRPHHVGYVLRTDKAEGGRAKEDFCRCYDYVRALHGRAITGSIERMKGNDHELIEVIAQEGEPIYQRFEVGLNARGQIIKAMHKYIALIEKLERRDGSKFDVNIHDKSDPVSYVELKVEIPVPEFPTLGEMDEASYDASILARQRERDVVWQRAEVDTWRAVRGTLRAEPVGPETPAINYAGAAFINAEDDEGPGTDSGPAPAPPDLDALVGGDEPKRGPGRPRKHPEATP